MSARMFAVSWLVLVTLAMAAELMAQNEDAEREQRRRRRPPPILSPVVGDKGSVTFRLEAPGAEKVALRGQWAEGDTDLQQADNGIWQTTVESVPPGVWEYSLVVDGLRMIDPGNAFIKPMRQPRTSILYLPAQPPAVHDFRDVPHGTVHIHDYWSKSLQRLRGLAVYTPPGYDSVSQAYPVFYLQHGSGDNHLTWTVHGKAHWILDNLIADGRAQPMLVVMADGHAAERRGRDGPSNTDLFARDLLDDVIPLIEANYRVNTEPASRAIAGLSMGGGQALAVGLQHSDRFAWVGAFSAGTPRDDSLTDLLERSSELNGQLNLLWIACGRDDRLLERNEVLVAALKQHGVRHQWQLTDGGHSWPVWRRYLAEMAPRLFQ